MPKGTPEAANSVLRGLPSMERILSSSAMAPLVAECGRARLKTAVAAHLETLRRARAPWDERDAAAAIRALAAQSTSSTLRRVINGSGVIIHTNPRRAGDLAAGGRGDRPLLESRVRSRRGRARRARRAPHRALRRALRQRGGDPHEQQRRGPAAAALGGGARAGGHRLPRRAGGDPRRG